MEWSFWAPIGCSWNFLICINTSKHTSAEAQHKHSTWIENENDVGPFCSIEFKFKHLLAPTSNNLHSRFAWILICIPIRPIKIETVSFSHFDGPLKSRLSLNTVLAFKSQRVKGSNWMSETLKYNRLGRIGMLLAWHYSSSSTRIAIALMRLCSHTRYLKYLKLFSVR